MISKLSHGVLVYEVYNKKFLTELRITGITIDVEKIWYSLSGKKNKIEVVSEDELIFNPLEEPSKEKHLYFVNEEDAKKYIKNFNNYN